MKSVTLFALFIVGGFAAADPSFIERQTIGSVSFYAFPDEKLILVEIPPKVNVDLVAVDETSNLVNVTIRRQTSLDRSEVKSLRSQYQGYSISSLDDLARVRSVTLTLPTGREVPLSVARSGEVIVDGMITLDKSEFDHLRQKLRQKLLPTVQMVLSRATPTLIETENLAVPIGEICESARRSLSRDLSAAQAIAKISANMKRVIEKAAQPNTVEIIMERVLTSCLEIQKWVEPKEVSSLLDLPVRFVPIDRQQQFNYVKTKRDSARQNLSTNVEIEVGGDL